MISFQFCRVGGGGGGGEGWGGGVRGLGGSMVLNVTSLWFLLFGKFKERIGF